MLRLLAKSYDSKIYPDSPPDYALLTQHSRDVATACKALAIVDGQTALFNAGLELVDFKEFQKLLKANGWNQDIGKAGSHFQNMVSQNPQLKQLLRHETISGLLIWFEPSLQSWLKPISKDLFLSIWAAMGHHRKFGEETKPDVLTTSLTVYLNHPDFAAILNEMAKDLGLPLPPIFSKNLVITPSTREKGDWVAPIMVRNIQDDFIDKEEEISEPTKKLLAIIKAFGICADVAASAIAAQGRWATNYSLTDYIDNSLGKIGLVPQELSRLINYWAWERSESPRPDNYAQTLPPDFSPRPFQIQVANSTSFLTLAQAGCGSGKSLAAYMWGQNWCQKLTNEGRNNFRLFFCLPTTGTTTEHFKDYALESGIDAALTHSRASVDLKTMAETAEQEESSDNNNAADAAYSALRSMQDKLDSLALWSTPLVVTTTDTVLGLMSNARRAIYSFPAIMSSAIVFDEIHAFDDNLFGHLLVFLKNFPKLPVLLMTASLPQEKLAAIKAVRSDLNPIAGPPEFELLERYVLNYPVDEAAIWKAVKETISQKGKVLWVRNRVEWANERYRECRAKFPELIPQQAINVYHSRLRYKDRSHRHRQVIDKFKQKGTPAILVATQVAEMSLDLSADLLITDIAPVPALIQRLGRLNRYSLPDPKPALICPLPNKDPNEEKPYEKDDLALAVDWIASLTNLGRAISQRDLSDAFIKFSNTDSFDIAQAEERAIFFSGLWRTRPGQTRTEGHTISVILEKDLNDPKVCNEKDRYGDPTSDWIRKYEVSIPIKEEIKKWDRVGAIRIAPSKSVEYIYDEKTKEGTGAKWK